MCEVPQRSWRALWRPQRIALALAAVVTAVVGGYVETTVGLVLIAAGAGLLLLAVVLPAVTEVELGFPAGVKVVAAARQRENQLRAALTDHRGDLELCARLLSGDPEAGPRLLEAAWAQATVRWRGPVGPELRTYVLCVLVQLVHAHLRWAGAAPAAGPLGGLGWDERAAVVLHEFAGLSVPEMATLLGRPAGEVAHRLQTAEATLAGAGPRP